jgi:peptidoglycan-associated lipoprotein
MKMKGFQAKSTRAMSFLSSNATRIKGGKMRRTLLAWRIVAVAGLMLFALSACASRQTTAPTMTDDQTTAPSSEISNEEALARQQALEEQQRQDEADRRQFESERNRFVYEDIFFARNQYRLDENARREMEWKAAWLLTYPDIKVLIEGHCDEGGRPEDNLALGMRRAGEVQSFFLRRGIARVRLSAISYGKERPVATGEGEEVRAKNRRVRTLIVDE